MFGLWSFLKKKVYKRVYNAICIYYPRHILRHYIISWKHWQVGHPPPPPFGVLILIWWLNTYVIFYLLNGNNFLFLSDYVFLNKKHIMFPNKTSTPRSVFHNYIHYLLKNYVSISFLHFYKIWLKANASKRFCIIHVKSIFNSKSFR